jgi:NADPH-dependent 2,4-dienoyl-CoA reductase/sulfur reductase-like enzyme/rhodanese-related sulfurtransferase
MKVIVIGAVAAGTTAAAKIRRNSETAEITVYEKGRYISYSGCGLPYFLGDGAPFDGMIPRGPDWFRSRYRVDVKTGCEVLSIDPRARKVAIAGPGGSAFEDSWDRLLIATGAAPFLPEIPGIRSANVFTLRDPQDAADIDRFLREKSPRKAVIAGSGYVGLEMAEAFAHRGLEVAIVEMAPQVMPNWDSDIAGSVRDALEANGVKVLTAAKAAGFAVKDGLARALLGADGSAAEGDVFLWAGGIRPVVALAAGAGVALGPTGAIATDASMRTNVEDVYAAGDCCESPSILTGKPVWRPLGSVANRTGRIAGDAMTGGALRFRGILGTAIFRAFDAVAARTGLTGAEAAAMGYDTETVVVTKPNKPDYFRDSAEMTIKAVADRRTGRLLGAQIVGGEGVDKRVDVIATAMTFGAKADDLAQLDLSYAPPFSTTKDPVHYVGMVLGDAMDEGRHSIDPRELAERIAKGEKIVVVDVRSARDRDRGHIEGSLHIPLERIRERASELPRDAVIVTYCNKGVSGNAAQNILLNMGYAGALSLRGGYRQYRKEIAP